MAFKFDVIAPFEGYVDRIFFQQGDLVEEGDLLFTLRVNGVVHDILSPITGYTDTMEVEPGEFVLSGMVLTCITEADESRLTVSFSRPPD